MTTLVDDEWHGPVSASPAAAAAARYTRWLRTTAAWADRNARQADAAVAAYETAFAATVPPSVVAANRSQLTLLVATNFLGQNSPAIMATQLQYIEMWAQDAQAMTSYALASMAAAQLTSPSPPPQAVKGTDDRDAGANGLKDDGPPDWWTDFMNNWGPNSNTMNSLATIVAGFMVPTTWTGLVAGGEVAAAAADGAEVIGDGAVAAAADAGMLGAALSGATGFGSVTASTGNATLIGKLSVPPSWTTASEITRVSSAIGTPLVAPAQAAAAGMPGMPMAHMAARNVGRHAPQYGFRPQMVARPPCGG